jgi:hypothetical protein
MVMGKTTRTVAVTLLALVATGGLGSPRIARAGVDTLAASPAPTRALGRVPVYFEANHGQADTRVRFLARAGGSVVYLTPDEMVLSVLRPASSPPTRQAVRMQLVGANPDFPIALALQPALLGLEDVFVASLDPSGSQLVYSTYLGGTNAERGRGLALDAAGGVYVTGITHSADFPISSPDPAGPFQPVKGSGADAFVAKLHFSDSGGTVTLALEYATFLGGSGDGDFANAIAVDGLSRAYVTGQTNSPDFPTEGAVQPVYGGGPHDAFVTRLNPQGGRKNSYSTFLGGSGDDFGDAIAVTSPGHAYVAGSTNSTNFPVTNPIQPAKAGSDDAFVTKFNVAGTGHVYSTYFGGTGSDRGRGSAVAGNGVIVSGSTRSTNFPALTLDPAGPFQPTLAGAPPFADAFVLRIRPYLFRLFVGAGLLQLTRLGSSFALTGTLGTSARGQRVDPRHEDVVVTLGAFAQAIPAGAFVRVDRGFRFDAREPGGGIEHMEIADAGDFGLTAAGVDLGDVRLPAVLPFALEIGDEAGETALAFDRGGNLRPRSGSPDPTR